MLPPEGSHRFCCWCPMSPENILTWWLPCDFVSGVLRYYYIEEDTLNGEASQRGGGTAETDGGGDVNTHVYGHAWRESCCK